MLQVEMTAMTSPTEHTLIEARSPENGKLHAHRIANAFGMSMRELAQVLERDASGLSKHPTSDSGTAASSGDHRRAVA